MLDGYVEYLQYRRAKIGRPDPSPWTDSVPREHRSEYQRLSAPMRARYTPGDRDAAWIERNLGDVEYIGRTVTIGEVTISGIGAGPYTYAIPVESLGREIEDAGLDGCDVQYPVLIF